MLYLVTFKYSKSGLFLFLFFLNFQTDFIKHVLEDKGGSTGERKTLGTDLGLLLLFSLWSGS